MIRITEARFTITYDPLAKNNLDRSTTMMNMILFSLLVVSVIAGPPFPLPGGASEDSLSPQCQTPKCPAAKADSNAPITLPYPLDCLQYIICEESGPRTVACPGDLVFNKSTGKCDTRQNANCVPCWQG